jgi:hypothetical protein
MSDRRVPLTQITEKTASDSTAFEDSLKDAVHWILDS